MTFRYSISSMALMIGAIVLTPSAIAQGPRGSQRGPDLPVDRVRRLEAQIRQLQSEVDDLQNRLRSIERRGGDRRFGPPGGSSRGRFDSDRRPGDARGFGPGFGRGVREDRDRWDDRPPMRGPGRPGDRPRMNREGPPRRPEFRTPPRSDRGGSPPMRRGDDDRGGPPPMRRGDDDRRGPRDSVGPPPQRRDDDRRPNIEPPPRRGSADRLPPESRRDDDRHPPRPKIDD